MIVVNRPAAGSTTATGTSTGTSTGSNTAQNVDTGQNATQTILNNTTATFSYSSTATSSTGGTAISTNSVTVDPKTTTATNVTTQTQLHSGSETATDIETASSKTATSAETDLSQKDAQISAAQLHGQSALEASTKGMLACAEGANQSLAGASVGGVLFQSCLHSLDAASKLKDLEKRDLANAGIENESMSLGVCESAVSSPAAQAITDDFETKFGISKSEFLQQMTEAKGNATALAGLLEGKLSKEKLVAALSAASAIPAEEKRQVLSESRVGQLSTGDCKYVVDQHVGSRKAGKNSTGKANGLRNSLRDSLRNTALESQRQEDSASKTGNTKAQDANDQRLRNLASDRLSASEENLFSQGNPELEELTIFDVIHAKYRSKTPVMAPR